MANTKFITNEDGQTLQERFVSRIKNTQFFDVLSGYFYSSGFKAIYPSLEIPKKFASQLVLVQIIKPMQQ